MPFDATSMPVGGEFFYDLLLANLSKRKREIEIEGAKEKGKKNKEEK